MSTFPAEEIAQLRQVVQTGRKFFSYIFMDAEAFFIATHRLKKSLAGFKITPCEDSNLPQPTDIHRQIDELEQLVDVAQGHIFGKVFVQPTNFLSYIDQLESSLKQVAERAASTEVDEVFPILSPDEMATIEKALEQPDTTVESAKAEAERIIAEAKREADRIVEQARRKAEQPWLIEPRDG